MRVASKHHPLHSSADFALAASGHRTTWTPEIPASIPFPSSSVGRPRRPPAPALVLGAPAPGSKSPALTNSIPCSNDGTTPVRHPFPPLKDAQRVVSPARPRLLPSCWNRFPRSTAPDPQLATVDPLGGSHRTSRGIRRWSRGRPFPSPESVPHVRDTRAFPRGFSFNDFESTSSSPGISLAQRGSPAWCRTPAFQQAAAGRSTEDGSRVAGVELARLTLGQKASRVLIFLLGAAKPRIAPHLARFGVNQAAPDEGCRRLRAVSGERLDSCCSSWGPRGNSNAFGTLRAKAANCFGGCRSENGTSCARWTWKSPRSSSAACWWRPLTPPCSSDRTCSRILCLPTS